MAIPKLLGTAGGVSSLLATTVALYLGNGSPVSANPTNNTFKVDGVEHCISYERNGETTVSKVDEGCNGTIDITKTHD